jgi:hypothetical protein
MALTKLERKLGPFYWNICHSLQLLSSIVNYKIYFKRYLLISYYVGHLSPWHDASSGRGWRRKGSRKYMENTVTKSQQGVVPQLWGWASCYQTLTVKK